MPPPVRPRRPSGGSPDGVGATARRSGAGAHLDPPGTSARDRTPRNSPSCPHKPRTGRSGPFLLLRFPVRGAPDLTPQSMAPVFNSPRLSEQWSTALPSVSYAENDVPQPQLDFALV